MLLSHYSEMGHSSSPSSLFLEHLISGDSLSRLYPVEILGNLL